MFSMVTESLHSGIFWGVRTVGGGTLSPRGVCCRCGGFWDTHLQISCVIMADFPSKVTTETSSPNSQSSQQGGNSLRGLAANVTIMMDMSFIRSIPAVLMMAEIVCNRPRAVFTVVNSIQFKLIFNSTLFWGQTSALLFSILYLMLNPSVD